MKRYKNLYIKRRILKLKIDIIGLITSGISEKKSKREILGNCQTLIQTLSVQLGLFDLEKQYLELDTVNEYNRISKSSYLKIKKLKKKDELNFETASLAIYTSIRAKILRNDLIKESNRVMYLYEHRTKHDEIYGPEGLLATATSPFFLASAHPKPAKDHAAYEGKLYYDEHWETKGEYDDAAKNAIRAVIRNRKIMTIQEVCAAPIYLCTRRNCKHYFKNVPLKEVLHSSPRSMLRKHGMYMKESDAPVSRTVLTYREYNDRKKVEEELMNTIPNPVLEKDLKKDKILLAKRSSK